MSLDDLHNATEYADAGTLDLDRMADVLREVLAGEPKACLSEIVQRQIARSAATEPMGAAADGTDQGDEHRALKAAVEGV